MGDGTSSVDRAPRWPSGSLLGALTPSQQRNLIGLGTQHTVDRGEILIHEGAGDRTVYLLLRGAVKVVSTSAAGCSVLLAVRLEGDVVGELAALDDLPRSATVVAAARTTYRRIGHEDFTAHLVGDPALNVLVHRSVVAKLRQATRMRSDTNSASTLVRLARVLTQLGDRYGRPTLAGRLLDLHLTQAELAGLIGIGEASVERALKELRRRGLVQTSYRQVVLRDVARLRKLAASR